MRMRLVQVGIAMALGLLAAGPLAAAPGDERGKQGSAYSNKSLGVTARGPAGWKMVADQSAAPTSWQRLVTFNDGATDAQAVLSVRPRTAVSADDLLALVRKAWDKSRGRLRVSSMRKIDASALQPIGRVVVDGSFTRTPKPKPSKDGVPAPPAAGVSYRVQATYYLGPGYEYLLYVQGQQTHWSRLRGGVAKLQSSLRFGAKEVDGPQGEGSYRNDAGGFACRFPKGYTVIVPQRKNHIVQFKGISEDDATLSVYAFGWESSARADADRLVAHYEDDKGGTAAVSTLEIGGQQGLLVTATAMLGGKDLTILLAIVKRGEECFRLRASMPKSAEAKGTAVFRQFVGSFNMRAAVK